MGKRPRKTRHRSAPVPWAQPRPVVIDDAYEAEVQRSTERLERRHAAALRAAQRADEKAQRAEEAAQAAAASTAKREAAEQARAAAEAAWLAFNELDRLIRQVPNGSGRGRVSRVGDSGSGGDSRDRAYAHRRGAR